MNYNNSVHVTLIYYCGKCKKWVTGYFDQGLKTCPDCDNNLTHVATVDPAMILQKLLNVVLRGENE